MNFTIDTENTGILNVFSLALWCKYPSIVINTGQGDYQVLGCVKMHRFWRVSDARYGIELFQKKRRGTIQWGLRAAEGRTCGLGEGLVVKERFDCEFRNSNLEFSASS
jgi:hypothetical protein